MLRQILIDSSKTKLPVSLTALLPALAEEGISVLSCAEVPAARKASAFLHSLAQAAINADECLILTDNEAGSCAAHSAGIACVGFQSAAGNASADAHNALETGNVSTGTYNAAGNASANALSAADNALSVAEAGSTHFSYTPYFIEGFEEVTAGYLHKLFAHLHGLPALICRTERLELRELPLSDVPALFAMYQKEDNTAFLTERMVSLKEELEKQQACIETWYPYFDYGMWGVYLKSSPTLIGRAGIAAAEISGAFEYELGYLIDTPFRRQGYAAECVRAVLEYVKELGMESVCARIHRENTASLHVLRRCGFPYVKEPSKETAFWLFRIRLN